MADNKELAVIDGELEISAVSESKLREQIAILIRRVESRNDLATFLGFGLGSLTFEDGATLTGGPNFVKSYLIESDMKRYASVEEKWGRDFSVIRHLASDSLLILRDRRGAYFVADVADERFCIVHSIEAVGSADRAMNYLGDVNVRDFDRAWLPSETLIAARRGILRGFKFFNRELAHGVDEAASIQALSSDITVPKQYEQADLGLVPLESLPAALTVASEGPPPPNKVKPARLEIADDVYALDYLSVFRKNPLFQGRQSLDWIQYFASSSATGRAINHGLYSNGKCMANGDSVSLHIWLMTELRDRYARVVRHIESDLSLGAKGEGASRAFGGETLIFKFPDTLTIQNIATFSESVFNEEKFFQLASFVRKSSDNRIDLEVIDLHVNQTFAVDVKTDRIRVFLRSESCGNVIARLYRNLQRFVHAGITLETGSGNRVFEVEDQFL